MSIGFRSPAVALFPHLISVVFRCAAATAGDKRRVGRRRSSSFISANYFQSFVSLILEFSGSFLLCRGIYSRGDSVRRKHTPHSYILLDWAF
ncbi:MAG: hypothetical protein VR65_04830 [Desulfobulbaceae bacterium BRH_c16a]|nr:MAG: hypothetical protein VR65_04245 [Desulfobulbaceae bacterium BRH_c16a]KJS02752.1 MAG: hypothetical protein VR65_04830 [Desulfobulbaceae bacterium BRH_c16a]